MAAAFEDLLLEIDRLRSVSERIENPGGQTSRHGRWTLECRGKHSQYCHGFGRFHAHPKQGGRPARRGAEPTNKWLHELSSAGARSSAELWISREDTLTAGPLARGGYRRPDPTFEACNGILKSADLTDAGLNMTAPPGMRDLAHRLLAYEAGAGKTSEPMEFRDPSRL